MTTPDGASAVAALRVKQWLPAWEQVNFDPAQNQAKPNPHFYVFSLSAAQLRKLARAGETCRVRRRLTASNRSQAMPRLRQRAV